MQRSRRYRIFAFALLGVTVLLVSILFPSAMHSARIVGMGGKVQAGGFLVEGVEAGSPAQSAGIRQGDVVTEIDNRSIAHWHDLARTNLSKYIAERRGWDGRSIDVTVMRDGVRITTVLTVRELRYLEFARYFLPRLAVIIVMIALAVFILMSNPKDRTALYVSICFFAFICGIAFDRPAWPEFLSPVLVTYGSTEFLTRELMATFGMQITLSSLLHVLLAFPKPLLPARFRVPVISITYIVPSAVIASMFVLPWPENPVDRLAPMYDLRIWMDTSLLIVAAALIVLNSFGDKTRIQQEQARWLMTAVIIFALLHVGLWNLPKILIGSPLLPSYNWMLILALMIPLAITVSIANHNLFGIHGLIRRRIRYLSHLAERQKNAVGRRDDVIKDLTRDMEQMREELERYLELDEIPESNADSNDRLQRLERDYPAIREARRTHLLGRSPLWLKVFEQAILASRGDTPALIVGESGTGKTELARTIAAMSDRPAEPYREISCAQFEHADPAFALGRLFGIGTAHGLPNTVQSGQRGILEECDGGTLFLDDFDRLPLNAQDLLLYPLEGKSFEPGIGSGPPRQVSLKFILATNRDTDELVAEGQLRSDVLARMGAQVYIPPLRERTEDLPLLIEHLVPVIAEEFGHEIESISPRAMKTLQGHHFQKGNVRELYSELRTAIGKASLEHDSLIRFEYLSSDLRETDSSTYTAGPASGRLRRAVREPDTKDASAGTSQPDMLDELEVLRRNRFRISPSEEELGLSHKSKTLSNHLRGRCIQELADHEWDLDRAAHSLAGSEDRQVVSKLHRKMARYLESIRRNVVEGREERLFSNLPAAYHEALTRTIRHVKSK